MTRAVVVLALGVATTLGSALALAVLMPLEMYPRQDSYEFLADGRAWSAVQRTRLGVWNLWWSEINAAYMTAPPPPAEQLRNSLLGLIGKAPAVDPALPTTAAGWLEYARAQRKTNRPASPIAYHDAPPRWGSFAAGPVPPRGVSAGTDHGFGWPLPALWYRVHGAYVRNYALASEIEGGRLIMARGGLEIRAYDFRALPLLPSWPGLLADTALFGCLWAAVLFGPGLVRRRVRARRGRCPRCGYDARNLPEGAPCPECGPGSS